MHGPSGLWVYGGVGTGLMLQGKDAAAVDDTHASNKNSRAQGGEWLPPAAVACHMPEPDDLMPPGLTICRQEKGKTHAV